RQRIGGARAVGRRRDDVELQVGAKPQRLLEEDVAGGHQLDAEGAGCARDRGRAVVEREDVSAGEVGGDRRRVAGNRQNQVLGLARGERQWTHLEQVDVELRRGGWT